MDTTEIQNNSKLLNDLANDLKNNTLPIDTTSQIQSNDLLEQIVNNSDITASVLQLAQNIDISWIEISARICIAAIIILIFKEIIFSIYRYICIRMDRYIGIGTIIKFQNQTYGRIEDYDLRTISIRTKDGLVKIPLEVWLNSYYTQISKDAYDINNTTDIDNIRKMIQCTNHNQDTKLNYLYNELNELKNINPSSQMKSTDTEIEYENINNEIDTKQNK